MGPWDGARAKDCSLRSSRLGTALCRGFWTRKPGGQRCRQAQAPPAPPAASWWGAPSSPPRLAGALAKSQQCQRSGPLQGQALAPCLCPGDGYVWASSPHLEGRKERSRWHRCCWPQGAGAGRDEDLGQLGEKSPQETQPRAACWEGSCFSPQPPSRCPSPLRALSLSIAAGCPQIDTTLSLGPPPTGPTSNWATAGTHGRGM